MSRLQPLTRACRWGAGCYESSWQARGWQWLSLPMRWALPAGGNRVIFMDSGLHTWGLHPWKKCLTHPNQDRRRHVLRNIINTSNLTKTSFHRVNNKKQASPFGSLCFFVVCKKFLTSGWCFFNACSYNRNKIIQWFFIFFFNCAIFFMSYLLQMFHRWTFTVFCWYKRLLPFHQLFYRWDMRPEFLFLCPSGRCPPCMGFWQEYQFWLCYLLQAYHRYV